MTVVNPEEMTDEQRAEAAAEARDTEALRSARAAAERNEGKAKRADALEVENIALRVLGVDVVDKPLAKMALDNYKGDATPEAIKAYAESMGLIEASATPDPASTPEAALAAERAGLQVGALPPLTPEEVARQEQNQKSPQERGLEEFQNGLKRGLPRERAVAGYFGTMIDAAVKGDERATFTGWTEDELAGY